MIKRLLQSLPITLLIWGVILFFITHVSPYSTKHSLENGYIIILLILIMLGIFLPIVVISKRVLLTFIYAIGTCFILGVRIYHIIPISFTVVSLVLLPSAILIFNQLKLHKKNREEKVIVKDEAPIQSQS